MFLIEDKPLEVKEKREIVSTYPFSELDIGQSFLVPNNHTSNKNMKVYASRFSKRFGVKMVTKIEGEGTRVYRVK